jgi:uncharacterized membrane protein
MKRMKSKLKNEISETIVPITGTKNGDRKSIWYILLVTLAPLYLLAIIGAGVFALVLLSRYLISPSNFLLQQKFFIIIMIIGIIVAIIVYAISVRHALVEIGKLRQHGQTMQAKIGLIALVIVASMMILPIILALFFH